MKIERGICAMKEALCVKNFCKYSVIIFWVVFASRHPFNQSMHISCCDVQRGYSTQEIGAPCGPLFKFSQYLTLYSSTHGSNSTQTSCILSVVYCNKVRYNLYLILNKKRPLFGKIYTLDELDCTESSRVSLTGNSAKKNVYCAYPCSI